VAEQSTKILGVVGLSPGGVFLYIFCTFLYSCSQFEAFRGMKTSWFFFEKKRFRSIPEKIPYKFS
jgi:hypothetical protein